MITVVITQVTGPTGLPLPQEGNNVFPSMLPYQVRRVACVAEAFLYSPNNNKLTEIIKIDMSQSGVIVKVDVIVNLLLQILINLCYIQLSTINTA